MLPEELTDAYIGHLMAEPKRHVTGLGELTDEEASALGRLVNDLARALVQVQGAEHVYSFVLGDEVDHLHIHVVPRYPGTPREYWGSRLGEWPAAPRGGVNEMAAVCDLIQGAVAREPAQDSGTPWR